MEAKVQQDVVFHIIKDTNYQPGILYEVKTCANTQTKWKQRFTTRHFSLMKILKDVHYKQKKNYPIWKFWDVSKKQRKERVKYVGTSTNMDKILKKLWTYLVFL